MKQWHIQGTKCAQNDDSDDSDDQDELTAAAGGGRAGREDAREEEARLERDLADMEHAHNPGADRYRNLGTGGQVEFQWEGKRQEELSENFAKPNYRFTANYESEEDDDAHHRDVVGRYNDSDVEAMFAPDDYGEEQCRRAYYINKDSGGRKEFWSALPGREVRQLGGFRVFDMSEGSGQLQIALLMEKCREPGRDIHSERKNMYIYEHTPACPDT